MTFRDLLDNLQMMAEVEPSMLNKEVICTLQDEEYFFVSNVFVEKLENQFVDKYQPLLTLEP